MKRDAYVGGFTTAAVREALAAEAKRQGRSRSAMIHRILAKALKVQDETTQEAR